MRAKQECGHSPTREVDTG